MYEGHNLSYLHFLFKSHYQPGQWHTYLSPQHFTLCCLCLYFCLNPKSTQFLFMGRRVIPLLFPSPLFFKSHNQPDQWHTNLSWADYPMLSPPPLLFKSQTNSISIYRGPYSVSISISSYVQIPNWLKYCLWRCDTLFPSPLSVQILLTSLNNDIPTSLLITLSYTVSISISIIRFVQNPNWLNSYLWEDYILSISPLFV